MSEQGARLTQRYLPQAPSRQVPVFLPPVPMFLPDSSLLESARNYRNANPLPRLLIRLRHNSPMPQAATAQLVFLLPFPRPLRVHPDRANRGLAPIRGAPALHPQNFPDPKAQSPARVRMSARGCSPPSAQSHHLARGGPCPSMPLLPEFSPRWRAREPLPRVAAQISPSKLGDPGEQTASSARHLLRLSELPAHPRDRTRPPAESPGYAQAKDPTLRTGKLHTRFGLA